jgi:hypothetical protein
MYELAKTLESVLKKCDDCNNNLHKKKMSYYMKRFVLYFYSINGDINDGANVITDSIDDINGITDGINDDINDDTNGITVGVEDSNGITDGVSAFIENGINQ